MVDFEDDFNFEDYDTGPFCIHWSDQDCQEKCASCGHFCAHHGWGFNECYECSCSEYTMKRKENDM